jgi:hypothetical protein
VTYSVRLGYLDNPEVIAVNCNPKHNEGEVKQSMEIATLARRSASVRRRVARAPGNDYFLLSFAIDTCQAAAVLHKTVIADH